MLMPVVLTAIMLIVQLGLWFHASHLVHAAAQDGVAAARAFDGTPEAGRVAATELLAFGGRLLVSPSVTVAQGAEETRVEVRALVRPVVPGWHWPVSAVAHSPRERFTTP